MFILLLLLDIIAPTAATTTTGLAFSTVSSITSLTIPWTKTPATIKYTPAANPAAVKTSLTFSGTAYSFASSTTATKAIQVYANTTVAITLDTLLDNPILLYCSNWPPGTYTFMNVATIKSKNNGATIKPSGAVEAILTIPNGGGNFNGILQFPLAASRTLKWLPVPKSQTIKLSFAVGQLIFCPKPTGVPSGLVAGTCSGLYNSVCTYTCAPGYLAHSYTSAKCTVSGTYEFSTALTACTAIKCTPPTQVDSTLQQKSGTCGGAYNSVCSYSCKSGYNSGTFTSHACNVTGSYVFSQPLKPCLAITCATPATLDPSLQLKNSGTCDGSYNSICNITCKSYYSGRPDQMSEPCTISGSYAFSTPLQPCLAQCRSRPTWAPPQYQFPASNWSVAPVDSGYKGTYVCVQGAAPTTSWETFIDTCINGTWSNTTGTCTPITCTVPADLAGRNIIVANRCGGSYNSLCDVKCTGAGYDNTQWYTSTSCSVTGDYQWASPIVCKPLTCYTNTFDSSWIATPGTCSGSYGSTCTLTCAANYVPEQYTTTSTCTSGWYSFQYVSGTYQGFDPNVDPCRLTTKIYFSSRQTYLLDTFPTPPFNSTVLKSTITADNYCDVTSCTFFTQLNLITGQTLYNFYNVPLTPGYTYSNNTGWVYQP